MSFLKLKKELDKLQGINDSPVVIFTYHNLKFHLRDLTAEEESRVSEYSYAQVELAASSDKQSFSRSMRSMLIYRLAYTAVAIRKIELLDDEGAVVTTWNLDIHLDDEIPEVKASKFSYLIDTIRGWGKDLATLLYDSLEAARAQRADYTKQYVHIEGIELPPQPKEGEQEGSRFQKHKDIDEIENSGALA